MMYRTIALVFIAAVTAGCSQPEPEDLAYAEGDPVPPVENIEYLQGTPVDFTDDHKAYVIEFWATWCAPCKESAVALTKLQRKYDEHGLLVAGFSDEKDSMVKPYLAQYGENMAYTIGLDPLGAVKKDFLDNYTPDPMMGIPWAFLMDADGKLVWRGHPMDKELDTKIAELLNVEEPDAS